MLPTSVLCLLTLVSCTKNKNSAEFLSVYCIFCHQNLKMFANTHKVHAYYRGADKSLARPARKQATATEDFDSW